MVKYFDMNAAEVHEAILNNPRIHELRRIVEIKKPVETRRTEDIKANSLLNEIFKHLGSFFNKSEPQLCMDMALRVKP